jgi:glycosyltransferase involved in cell wall biosynthesis
LHSQRDDTGNHHDYKCSIRESVSGVVVNKSERKTDYIKPSESAVGTKKIVVCGTARNVARSIEDFVRRIRDVVSDFQEVQIVICESFSSDNTNEILSKLMVEFKNLNYFSDNSIPNFEARRTLRIASARNMLKQHIQDNFSHFDYVAMMDLDGVNRNLTRKAFLSPWSHSDWDVATANQSLLYYDLWALRAKGWSEGDCWVEYNLLTQQMSQKKAKKMAITSKMKKIPRRSKPIKVESAFGGLGIYRMEAFLSGNYAGLDSTGNELCEHVPFHADLVENGYRIYIFPQLVNMNAFSQIINLIKDFSTRLLKVRKLST